MKKWPNNFKFNKNRCVYTINSLIARNPFDALSLAIFFLLIVSGHVIPDFSSSFINNHPGLKYAIIMWMLFNFESGCQWTRGLSKEFNSVRITILLVILTFVACFPIMISFLLSIKASFDYVIITILFFFFPLYYSTMAMLDIVENPLLRNFLGYVFSVLIAGYTALTIGIYNFYISETTENLSTYTDIAKMIVKGIVNLSQNSLKDIIMTGEDVNLDRVMQFLIAGYGILVIAHIKKVASGTKEKADEK